MEILEQEQLTAGERRVVTISQDSFYKALPESDRKLAEEGKYNFDHPDALDAPRIVETIRSLKRGEQVNIPKYDFKNNRPDPDNFDTVYPADVIILEGILVFHYAELRDMFHLKLFVDLDADSRLARRVVRDNQHRGRSLQNILRQYVQFVKPAFEDFCLPTKIYADIIIPRGAENDVAIVLICQHIKQYLPQPQQQQQQLGINVAGARELHHSVSEITLPTALHVSNNNESTSASRQLGNFSNAFSPASPAPKNSAPTNIDIPAAATSATSIHSDRAHHSSAYMRARSFNNESSVTTTTNDLNLSDDDDQEDHAFESEFVHHRHHTFTTQVSRRRRERERTLSTGSMSRMVSVDNSFNSSGLSTNSSSQQQSPLANPINLMNQSSSSDQASPHHATSKT